MKAGVNLYGLGNLAGKEYKTTIDQLFRDGFGSVEPLVMLECDRAEMEGKPFLPPAIWMQSDLVERSHELRDRYDMHIFSCHLGGLPGEDFSGKTGSMINILQDTDVKDFVYSRMHRNAEDCRRDAEIFIKTAEEIAPYGGRLLYHNHEAEQKNIDTEYGKMMIIDYFLKLCGGRVLLEPDLGWVMYSGTDAVKFAADHINQIARIHLKDFKKGYVFERREKDICATGEGELPLAEILKIAVGNGLHEDAVIIDQDCSEGDIMDDILTGINNINKIVEG